MFENWRHISEALESALMDAMDEAETQNRAKRKAASPPATGGSSAAMDGESGTRKVEKALYTLAPGPGAGEVVRADTGIEFGTGRDAYDEVANLRPGQLLLTTEVLASICEPIAPPPRLSPPLAMGSQILVLRRKYHARSPSTGEGFLL